MIRNAANGYQCFCLVSQEQPSNGQEPQHEVRQAAKASPGSNHSDGVDVDDMVTEKTKLKVARDVCYANNDDVNEGSLDDGDDEMPGAFHVDGPNAGNISSNQSILVGGDGGSSRCISDSHGTNAEMQLDGYRWTPQDDSENEIWMRPNGDLYKYS